MLYVGTSGYSYKEWKGRFYPAQLPAKDMLHYYASHFQAVELNNTFIVSRNPAWSTIGRLRFLTTSGSQ